MNKELIKTYKAEFNHWLNDKEVLACPIKNKLNGYAVDWQPIDENALWNNKDIVYIINDEYVEFRKAMAECKIIQMYCKYDGVPPFWDDMTEVIKSIGFVMTKDSYRIKPEEPKFQVGELK